MEPAASPGEESGSRALLDAISKEQMHLARFLLDAVDNRIVEWRGEGARTPLMCSVLLPLPAARGRFMRLLLERGAQVNSRDGAGRTPLSLACERGFLDAVRLLVQHNADPELADLWGNTPLLYGAASGHGEVLAFLVRAFKRLGLDIERPNLVGNSARRVASFLGHRHCVLALGSAPRKGAERVQLPPCQDTGQLRGGRGQDGDWDRDRDRDKDWARDKDKGWVKDWDDFRDMDKDRNKERLRDKDRDSVRDKDWVRDWGRNKDRVTDKDRDSVRERDSVRDKDRDSVRDKDRDKDWVRDWVTDKDRDSVRERDRDKDSDSVRDRDSVRDKDRDRVKDRIRAVALRTRLETMGSIDEEERDQDPVTSLSQSPQSPKSRLRSRSVQYAGLLPPLTHFWEVCTVRSAAPYSPRPARGAASPWYQPAAGSSALGILLTPIRGAAAPPAPQCRASPGLPGFEQSFHQKRCSLPSSALPPWAPDKLLPPCQTGAAARSGLPTAIANLGNKLLRRFTLPDFRKGSRDQEEGGSAAVRGLSRSETFPVSRTHPQLSNNSSIDSMSAVQCEFTEQ